MTIRPRVAAAAVLGLLCLESATSMALAEPVTDTHPILLVVVAASCGTVHTERFELPEDAIVTQAGVRVTLDAANTTALGATVEVHAGAAVLARNNSADGLGWLGEGGRLNATAINAHLLNQSAAGGLVGLDLDVSVCPTLGVASVIIHEATLTWDGTAPNGSQNGSSLPAINGVSIGGALTTSVEAGAPLTLVALANGTIGAGVHVSWFVDGSLVGHGASLSNYTFSPGEHNVSVRASDGSAVTAYNLHISAAARPPPGAFPLPALAVAALAGVAALGLATAGTERGRWLLLGVVVGSVFKRLKRASLLDHFVRGQLYQVIRENPGIHFAELRRRAGLANGAASYHLRVLEQGAYIRVVLDGTKTRFHTTDRPLDEAVYGISDTDRAVLDAVADAPGISQGELIVKVNRSASVVSRSVSRLVSLGYVTTAHESGRVQVFPRAGAELAKVLTPAWPDEGA